MSFKQLFIFFFKDSKGKPKLSYLFSVIGLFFSTYAIFMIMSIMNGIEYNFLKKIDSYHYKYYLKNNQFINQDNKTSYNPGFEKNICIQNSNTYSKIIGFGNFDKYFKTKLSNYCTYNKSVELNSNHIILGYDIAKKLNANIGERVSLFYPSDINIASNFVEYKDFEIYGIFNIDFLDFNNNILTNLNNLEVDNDNNLKYFFDDLNYKNRSNFFNNNIYSNLIIDGLNLEKKIYYFFAFFAIVLSCFILFSIMTTLINEKIKQFFIINILGMTIYELTLKLFFLNYLLSSFMVLISLSFVNLSLYLFNQYNFFTLIYEALPFSPIFIKFFDLETLSLFFIITVIISLFSTLPMYYLNKKDKYVRF